LEFIRQIAVAADAMQCDCMILNIKYNQ